MKRKTTEEFIKELKRIHGNKYDYSKVIYVNNHTKVTILDKINGNFFEMTPACLLNGQENPKLRYRKIREKLALSKNGFIEKACKVHGDKYDYSKVSYVNNRTKVCIICPEHGEFWQTPDKHLCGRGCPKCANKIKPTTEEFIEKAKLLYGDKYTYEKTIYGKNNKEKITITCPKHGDFNIAPVLFLSGRGCKYCTKGEIFSKNDFIKKARKIHGDRYDYSKINYQGMLKKVTIVCPEHGDFEQTPAKHVSCSNGCPKCANEMNISETKLYNFVVSYFNNEKIIHSYHNKLLLGKQELDIFFEKHNIAIEYQGLQHFEPVDFGGNGKQIANRLFLDNIKRDKQKKEKCKNNNIKLYYYSDVEYDEFLGEKVYHNYTELCEVIKKETEK